MWAGIGGGEAGPSTALRFGRDDRVCGLEKRVKRQSAGLGVEDEVEVVPVLFGEGDGGGGNILFEVFE